MKDQILQEIRRTARANGGVPLGRQRFERETGIGSGEWYGKYWKSWGDAVREAGLEANSLQGRTADDELLRSFADFARDLGRLPVTGDLRIRRQSDKAFPSHGVFTRLGSRVELLARVREFCTRNPGYSAVLEIIPSEADCAPSGTEDDDAITGFVYLVKAGRYHKIGRTLNPLRREGEIRLQLPEKLAPIHYIETDDPAGVEAYWHARFAAKRQEGEWFTLTADDVRAFKKWKRIS
jgi:hypothetical protein